jgi:hypothetical protein
LVRYDIYLKIMLLRAPLKIRCACCRPAMGLVHRAGVGSV